MTLGTTYTRTAPDGRQKTFTITNEDERKYHLDLQEHGFTYKQSGFMNKQKTVAEIMRKQKINPESYQQSGEVTDPFSDATIRVHHAPPTGCSACEA